METEGPGIAGSGEGGRPVTAPGQAAGVAWTAPGAAKAA